MFSGKTTAANVLLSEGYWRASFAKPVKELTAKILSLSEQEIGDYHTWTVQEVERRKGEPQVRQLLQFVGTQIGRELIGYDNLWVDKLVNFIQPLTAVVVDDARFPNEVQALRENNFTIVRIIRPEADRVALLQERYPETWESVMNHESERLIDSLPYDFAVNADTVYDLEHKIRMTFL